MKLIPPQEILAVRYIRLHTVIIRVYEVCPAVPSPPSDSRCWDHIRGQAILNISHIIQYTYHSCCMLQPIERFCSNNNGSCEKKAGTKWSIALFFISGFCTFQVDIACSGIYSTRPTLLVRPITALFRPLWSAYLGQAGPIHYQ